MVGDGADKTGIPGVIRNVGLVLGRVCRYGSDLGQIKAVDGNLTDGTVDRKIGGFLTGKQVPLVGGLDHRISRCFLPRVFRRADSFAPAFITVGVGFQNIGLGIGRSSQDIAPVRGGFDSVGAIEII